MLDASEARRLTDGALTSDADAVRSYLKHIEGKIREAARKGRRSVSHPFSGPIHAPDGTILEAVRKAVEGKGYTWTDHPDPDPGHPCSRPYTSISW